MSKKILLSSLLITILPVTTIVVSCSNSKDNNNDNEGPTDVYFENTVFNKKITQASQLGIESYTAKEAIPKITSEFCFSKLDLFLRGDTSLIKSANDIEIESKINIANPNKVDIIFNIKPGKWYYNNKIQERKVEQIYVISGFREQPTYPVESLDKQGGNIDEVLYADKYKIIAEKLGLNQYNDISLLNINHLNSKLHLYSQFNKINLSFAEGSSTKLGQLKLKISGSYNNQQIEEEVITISNFFKLNENITLSIQTLDLNKTNWFNDKKPITTSRDKDISNITNEQWFTKYLNNFSINDANLSLNEKVIDLLMKKITFNFSLSNNEININFGGNYQNKKYENNKWIDDGSLIKIYQSLSTGIRKLALPTLNDFKSYLIKLITINESLLKQHYASYYQGVNKINIANSIAYVFDRYILNYDELIRKYKNDYFPNKQINFAINNDEGGIKSNDFTGKMSFNIYVLDQDEPTIKIYNKNFEVNNMKYLEDFIIPNTSNSVKIQKNGAIYNELISKMKEIKEEITNLFNQSEEAKIEIQLTNFKSLNNIIDFKSGKSWDDFNKSFNGLKNKIDPRIFNNNFTPINESSINSINQYQIGYLSNLYNPNGNEQDLFIISNIVYSTEPNIKMNVVKKHENNLFIEVVGKTTISFDEFDNVTDANTSFNFGLSKTEWDELILQKTL